MLPVPDQMESVIDELKRLNTNLQNLRQDNLGLRGELKTLNEQMRVLEIVAKRLGIFNQIMLQVRKSAGNAGMIQMLMETFVRSVKSMA